MSPVNVGRPEAFIIFLSNLYILFRPPQHTILDRYDLTEVRWPNLVLPAPGKTQELFCELGSLAHLCLYILQPLMDRTVGIGVQ